MYIFSELVLCELEVKFASFLYYWKSEKENGTLRKSAALSFGHSKCNASKNWRKVENESVITLGSLVTRFPLLTQLCAGYSVKLKKNYKYCCYTLTLQNT